MTRARQPTPAVAAVRCAVYTRKSSEEGLEQEFNSLDAQRESGEAFIASQAGLGWMCVPDRYDDGGFTGGNMDRPALKRLMADIEAGKIDCVVVYKVDRLSRSLLDFARMMELFERQRISFVSVTQQFNTASSMGRLVLNVLLSFAQFEREIISERTRDKIAATRRKGKWAGGHPILGYDVDPRGFRLVVNGEEASRVRSIYALYLEHQTLLATAKVLEKRHWLNKAWTTRKGTLRGGKPFDKCSLFKLLTNVTYTGKVKYKAEIHAGEHEAIVDADLWQRVQRLLTRNGRTGGAAVRNKYGAILKGLLHCGPCRCAMGHTYTSKGNVVKYRYYVCMRAQKRGWHTCPSKSVPAAEIERLVVEQIRSVGRNQAVHRATLAHAGGQAARELAAVEAEQQGARRELSRCYAEVRAAATQPPAPCRDSSARLADLHERIRVLERHAGDLQQRAILLGRKTVDEQEVATRLAAFEPLWETLTPAEQSRAINLLIKRVDYDGSSGSVSITLHEDALLERGEPAGPANESTAEEAA